MTTPPCGADTPRRCVSARHEAAISCAQRASAVKPKKWCLRCRRCRRAHRSSARSRRIQRELKKKRRSGWSCRARKYVRRSDATRDRCSSPRSPWCCSVLRRANMTITLRQSDRPELAVPLYYVHEQPAQHISGQPRAHLHFGFSVSCELTVTATPLGRAGAHVQCECSGGTTSGRVLNWQALRPPP